jgi:hypothetical protein
VQLGLLATLNEGDRADLITGVVEKQFIGFVRNNARHSIVIIQEGEYMGVLDK